IDNSIGYRVAAEMGVDPTCLDCALPDELHGDTWRWWLREFGSDDPETELSVTESPNGPPRQEAPTVPTNPRQLNQRLPSRPPPEQ
ncbi:MAG TPA: hypothetical protein PKD54_08295, partial [Pirellulaceae bacterium]|nr:hypothetical protein [Pirellulaceae bacterium]